MWSQQSTWVESFVGLFQILSFVILSMDLAYRQTLALLVTERYLSHDQTPTK